MMISRWLCAVVTAALLLLSAAPARAGGAGAEREKLFQLIRDLCGRMRRGERPETIAKRFGTPAAPQPGSWWYVDLPSDVRLTRMGAEVSSDGHRTSSIALRIREGFVLHVKDFVPAFGPHEELPLPPLHPGGTWYWQFSKTRGRARDCRVLAATGSGADDSVAVEEILLETER